MNPIRLCLFLLTAFFYLSFVSAQETPQDVATLVKMTEENEKRRAYAEARERQRIVALKKKYERLPTQAQLIQKQKAEMIATKGDQHYQNAEYPQAEKAYLQAFELYPNEGAYYFKYGSALFRNEKLEQSLIALRLAHTDEATSIEKEFFLGLIHYKLKEIPLAEKSFLEVKNTGHSLLAPSSSFYLGLVFMAKDELDKAQEAFEFVLDNSNDPQMDKNAEEYIEKIAKILQMKKMAEQKWVFNAKAAVNYDSNVLLISDTDAATAPASEKGGWRFNVGGDASYRFLYTDRKEFSSRVAFTHIYSLDDDFALADPTVTTLTTPFAIKGISDGEGYKWTFTPGIENFFMDYDESGQRSNILNSLVLNVDYLKMKKAYWWSSVALDYRYDDSQVSASADDNADAHKVGIKKTEMLFLDPSKKYVLMGFLGYVHNEARGENKSFGRIEGGAIFNAPWNTFKGTTWNAGFTVHQMNYSDAVPKREDRNMTILAGTTKILDDNWSWSTNGTYSANNSDSDVYTYSKYSLFLSLAYTWAR